MSLKSEYMSLLKTIEDELTDDFSADALDRFSFENDDEQAILRDFVEEKVSHTVRNSLERNRKKVDETEEISTKSRLHLIQQEIRSRVVHECSHEIGEIISPEAFESVRRAIKKEFEGGYGLVVVVGAGVSNAPRRIAVMAEQMLMANDVFPETHDYDFAEEYTDKWYKGWELFEENVSGFEKKFAAESGRPHVKATTCQQNIARLYKHKKLAQLVIFNWDNLVESAYLDLFGSALRLDKDIIVGDEVPDRWSGNLYIWHPHGYIEAPGLGLLLPHKDGFLPQKLEDHCLNDFFGTFVVIGFRDENHDTVHRLFRELGKRRRQIVRIRVDLRPNNLTLNLDGDRFSMLLAMWAGIGNNS